MFAVNRTRIVGNIVLTSTVLILTVTASTRASAVIGSPAGASNLRLPDRATPVGDPSTYTYQFSIADIPDAAHGLHINIDVTK